MKIKLQEAFNLIQAADVVRVADLHNFVEPRISFRGIHNKPHNEFLYICWDDGWGSYAAGFIEENNLEAERDGHKIVLTDNEGSEFEFHLFRLVPILP